MKRFLVLQRVTISNNHAQETMYEPVIDFNTYTEADDWINDQSDPTLFDIEDQFPEDDEEFEFYKHFMSDDEIWEADIDEHDSDFFSTNGDTD